MRKKRSSFFWINGILLKKTNSHSNSSLPESIFTRKYKKNSAFAKRTNTAIHTTKLKSIKKSNSIAEPSVMLLPLNRFKLQIGTRFQSFKTFVNVSNIMKTFFFHDRTSQNGLEVVLTININVSFIVQLG